MKSQVESNVGFPRKKKWAIPFYLLLLFGCSLSWTSMYAHIMAFKGPGIPKDLGLMEVDKGKAALSQTIVFTKDKKRAYFTRPYFIEGKIEQKLFSADNIGGTWQRITELPFNIHGYSIIFPALTPDDTRLYFSSNMPGSRGGFDIFYVNIRHSGSYGKPRNLGRGINTKNHEISPFVTSSKVLYFSSDGHSGKGGFDIFCVDLSPRKFLKVRKTQPLFNSNGHDHSLVYDEQKQVGYFVSNRHTTSKGYAKYAFYIKERQIVGPIPIETGKELSGAALSSLLNNDTYHRFFKSDLNYADTLFEDDGN